MFSEKKGVLYMKLLKLSLIVVFAALCFYPATSQAEFGFIEELEDFVEDLIDGHHHHHRKGFTFDVIRKDWTFSTDFVMTHDDLPIGVVAKTPFHLDLRAHYDLYDNENGLEAYAIRNWIGMTTAWVWGIKISIYIPGQDDRFGYIEGQALTFENACFYIYQNEELAAVAYLDRDSGTFSLFDPDTETRVLATYKRHFILDEADYWTVSVSEHCKISPIIIKMFATFAIDKQAYFKEDR